jgi:alpha-tubulin suppressor-like RCC1 family protein/serine/threonine protein kinase
MSEEPLREFPVFLTKGDVIKDRYQIVNMLGAPSGESLVYLCLDEKQNQNAVLKLYHLGFSPKMDIVKRLVELKHPDIINVLDHGYINNQFYEIMEYAEGGSLLERLTERAFSEEELAKSVVPEVINGLKSCHELGIIHRDLKPANIFYRSRERKDIVLGDFGISSVLEEGSSVRRSKAALTYDYASPEHFTEYIGKEADYYSLGMTLLHLLLRIAPMEGLTDAQKMHRHLAEKIQLPDNLGERFKRLLSGLLIKERKKRWGISEIERWLKGEDVPVYEDELRAIPPSSDPYKFTAKDVAYTPKELAILIQTFADRELVKKHFSKGWFSGWLGKIDQDLAYRVDKIEEKAKSVDLALLEISCLLNPEMPYILVPEEQAETPEELGSQINKHWRIGKEHIFSGKVSVWLKHAGYQNIFEKLETIRKEYGEQQDRGVEIFLQSLGLPAPELSIEPRALALGTIKNIEKVSQKVKLTHTGKRGYLYGEIGFSEEIDGVYLEKLALKELPRAGKTETDLINIRLWPGESIEFSLVIDTPKIPVGREYDLSLVTKTNALSELSIPLFFSIDLPAYSKKRSQKPLQVDEEVEIHTLRGLAEYCYQKWSQMDAQILSEQVVKDALFLLQDEELTTWIKEDLGERQIAQKVEEIVSADIAFSEKCYRFLKLSGVYEEERLFALFRQLRKKEFEVERDLKIETVKNEIQGRVEERSFRAYREGLGGALVRGVVGGCCLGGFLGPAIGALLLFLFWGALMGAPGAWILRGAPIGIPIGILIALRTRRRMLKKATMLPEEEKELSLRTQTIETEFSRKVAGIDEEIFMLSAAPSERSEIVKLQTKPEPERVRVSPRRRFPMWGKWIMGVVCVVIYIMGGIFIFGVALDIAPAPERRQLTDVASVAAGGASLAIRKDGTLWTWGWNTRGQVGDGMTTRRRRPVQVLTDVASVAAGGASLAIRKDGTLWAWGGNWAGQIGDGTTTDRHRPVQVLTHVVSVAAGNAHSLAIRRDGTLWAWGENEFGQLGDGTTTDRHRPVQVLTHVVSVGAGLRHSFAIRRDGTLWAWGSNGLGQLGDETTIDRHRPVQVLTDVVSVGAGWYHSLAIRRDGTLWAWGGNASGQVGAGTTSWGMKPVRVLTDVVSVPAGGNVHSLAIRRDGTLWAWGGNWAGQIGDGTTTERHRPVQVLTDVVSVAAGGNYSLAIRRDGTLWAWGWR